MNPLIETKKHLISDLCKKHHVNKLFAFGSIVNGSFTEKSDIDLLYEFDLDAFSWKGIDYDYIDNLNDFEKKLSDLFERKVDLIRNSNFNNHVFKNKVAVSKKLLYAK